jgi:hypothetical protein
MVLWGETIVEVLVVGKKGQIKTEDQIINIIKKDVKTRLQSKECFKNTILNRIICCNWAICIERLQRDGTAI